MKEEKLRQHHFEEALVEETKLEIEKMQKETYTSKSRVQSLMEEVSNNEYAESERTNLYKLDMEQMSVQTKILNEEI